MRDSLRFSWILLRSEWLQTLHSPQRLVQPLVFFLLVGSLFPLAMDADVKQLHQIGPGVLWVSALLASLLGLENLFRLDYQQGVIEQWCLASQPLALIGFITVLAHWLVTGLPLVIVTPLMAQWYQLSFAETKVLAMSLLLGTPILSFVGAIAQALVVHSRQGGVLLALLVLPLYIPVLIFGAGSVSHGVSAAGPLALLGAMLLLSLALAPFAIAGSLRLAV